MSTVTSVYVILQPRRVISDPDAPSDVEFSTPSGKPAQIVKIILIPSDETRKPKVCGLTLTACFHPEGIYGLNDIWFILIKFSSIAKETIMLL